MWQKYLVLLSLIITQNLLANYKITEVTLKETPTVVKKVKTSQSEAIGVIEKTLEEVKEYLKTKKLKITGPGFARTFEWSENNWIFEAGYPVAKTLEKDELDFTSAKLPSGKALKTIHVGPHEKSEAAYKAMEEWIVKKQKKKLGAPWEVFVSFDPKKNNSNAKTEIFYPVE